MFKKMLKIILVKYYAYKKSIVVEYANGISFKSIKNSGEGCRLLKKIEITKNVEIGHYTSIRGPSTRLSAEINKIKIGRFCSIASGVVMQEYYHKYNRITSYYINQNIFNELVKNDIFSKGNIIIEDDVWIGSNSIILSGVTIGRGSIIGAGSVVTKDIPKYSIVGGNPAKVIRRRFSQETIETLEKLKWWEWDVEKIKKNKVLFNLNLNKDTITEKLIK